VTAGWLTTGLIAGALLVIGTLDAVFAGFRASVGRTGLVRHRRADRLAARRGLFLGALVLLPIAFVVFVDLAARPGRLGLYRSGGSGLLIVCLPYGVVVLLALAAYLTMPWRLRFLASAVLLGPLTLVRPLVALAGAAVASIKAGDLIVGLLAWAAALGVLAVGPVAGRLWYRDGLVGDPPVERDFVPGSTRR
jgi:hypothetical protein